MIRLTTALPLISGCSIALAIFIAAFLIHLCR